MASAPKPPFPLGVFVGNPNGNDNSANARFLDAFDAFRTLMGASPGFMDAFTDFSQDPGQWAGNASWTAWSWAKTGDGYAGPGSGVVPVVGLPLASNAGGWGNVDSFYRSVLSGSLDADYRGVVQSWASHGYSTIQLRIAYEFDGNFMPWAPGNSGSPGVNADFVAAWQHVADLVHQQGAASGITVQTVWNPADINWARTPPAQLYPGDAYVDVISTDAYSPVYPLDLQNWVGSGQAADLSTWAADPANRAHYWQYSDGTQWRPTGNGAGWSFEDTVDLAAAHGKPLSISETGAGNNGTTTGPADDPAFAQWLAGALSAAEDRGVVVQNVNIWAIDQSDGSWGFLDGEKPLEAASWAANFGAGGGTSSAAASGESTPFPPAVPDPPPIQPAPIQPAPTAPQAPTPPAALDLRIDQSMFTPVNTVYIGIDQPWADATPAHPVATIIGQHSYDVIGTRSDGNSGRVLVTSTPVAVSDNQWNTTLSVPAQTADATPPTQAPDPFFDAAYYLAHNVDVAAAGADPYQHYSTVGWREGRNPSAAFDTNDYLAANPDVRAAGLDPLAHYEAFGRAEGRAEFAVPGTPSDPMVNAAYVYAERPDIRAAGLDAGAWYDSEGWKGGANPNAAFDTDYYLTQNPDVRAAGVNPLQHFDQFGWREGRDPSLLFSDGTYLAANPDVRAAGVDPLQHYLSNGQAEGRAAFLPGGSTAPVDYLVDAVFFDAQLGATLVPAGTAAAQQAAWSYGASGWQKGLNPDAFFDTKYYLSHNPDVAAAHIDPLLHYETSGWHEGRDPSGQFSTNKYLAAYPDVKAAGADPLLHYVLYGQGEGRQAFGA